MLSYLRGTIAGRLYLIGSLALAAVLTLASVSIYFATGTEKAAVVLYSGSLISSVEASEIELLLERHRRLIESAPHEFNRAAIKNDRDMSEKIIGKIEGLLRRTSGSFAVRVSPGLTRLAEQGREVLRLADNFAQDRAVPIVKEYGVQAEKLQASLRRYRSNTVNAAEREAQSLVQSANHLVEAVIGITLVVILLIGPTAILIMHNLLSRLNRITAAMSQLAQNNTGISLNSETRVADEIGAMAKAVEVFRNNAIALFDNKKRLEQVNDWLDIALNNMARGLSMFDEKQRLVVCNERYGEIYCLPNELTKPGVPFSRILEHRRQIVIEADEIEELVAQKQQLMVPRGVEMDEVRLSHKTHDHRIVEVSIKPLLRGGWVAVHEDVTERHDASERIARLAREDTLTGLANRHRYLEVLNSLTESPKTQFALLAIDLDRFKEVNDTFGHPVGDDLLAAVAARLMLVVRGSDLVARLGGDEFAIVLQQSTTRKAATIVARRIVNALKEPFQIGSNRIKIGGTVGIAFSLEDGSDADTLMRHADIALYSAKEKQRGTLAFYDSKIEDHQRSRRILEADLEQAVGLGQLELHYQPIVSLAHARVVGCEALIRWRHPERGLVPPGDFIPLAEETGLIIDIGAWALQEACAAASRWPGNLTVAVNLSVAQFDGPDLAATAAKALKQSNLAPSRLELEVTESLLLSHDDSTLDHLRRLQELGIAIALDDFGTGYSSLSHLRSFPFDKMKIDRTFVRDLHERSDCEAIVTAIISLTSSLNMAVVAEGVETELHLAHVHNAGCDMIQGYLFSKPVPEAQLALVIQSLDTRLSALSLTELCA